MRYCTFALLMALTLGCGSKPGGKKDESGPKDDAQALQGVWKAVAAIEDGEKMPDLDNRLSSYTAEFAGDRLVFKVNGEVAEINKISIDPTKSPKTIDLTVIDENGLTKKLNDRQNRAFDWVRQGIYSIEGDLLKLTAADGIGEPRPEKFDALPGTGLTVMTFQKVR